MTRTIQGRKARITTKSQPAQSGKAIPYFVSDKPGKYRATRVLTEPQIIKAALILSTRAVKRGESLSSPDIVRLYLHSRLKDLEREVFCCLFLDNQHRVIAFEEMFLGTISTAAVYPRELVKRALQHNAAAVILAHNHPSGTNEPSPADKHITNKIKQALDLVEIRTLDHFIIGDGGSFSFAEHELI